LLVVGDDLGETSRRYDRFFLLNKTIIVDGYRAKIITTNNIQQPYREGVFLLQNNEV
jgi:ABC-type Mn2+/Zn2+ transport system ATPase subunit